MFWALTKLSYRIQHRILKFVASILNFPVPELITGSGSVKNLARVVKSKGIRNVLVVTDKGLMGIQLLDGLFDSLKEEQIRYTVFDDVQENPTIQNIENGLTQYLAGQCEGIIAFGGGSPMDCAKVIGARATNRNRSVHKMRGLFKVKKALPPLFAVPTTAGTGSETTVAAVVTDPETHEKFAISDLKLVPQVAVLDPELMRGLPPHITSATGMDALTHAVEAYIGLNGTRFTNENAEKATRLIFENLEKAYKDGADLEARSHMAFASFYGGSAFTRAYVGYVHATVSISAGQLGRN